MGKQWRILDFTRQTELIGCEVVDLTFFSAMVDSGEEFAVILMLWFHLVSKIKIHDTGDLSLKLRYDGDSDIHFIFS